MISNPFSDTQVTAQVKNFSKSLNKFFESHFSNFKMSKIRLISNKVLQNDKRNEKMNEKILKK